MTIFEIAYLAACFSVPTLILAWVIEMILEYKMCKECREILKEGE